MQERLPARLGAAALAACLTLLLAGGAHADDADNAEELARIELEKKRVELEKLKVDLAKAKLELDKSGQPTPKVEALTGKTTIGDDVAIEAFVIASDRLEAAAGAIAEAVEKAKPASTPRSTLVVAAASDPALHTYLHELLRAQLTTFSAEYDRVLGLAGGLSKATTEVEAATLGAELARSEKGLADLTLNLRSALDLVSLFRAETEVEGASVSIDDFALVASVCGHLQDSYRVHAPNVHIAASGSPLLAQLREIIAKRVLAAELLTTLESPSPSDQQERTAALLTALNGLWDDLVTRLSAENDATGGALIQALGRAEAVAEPDAHLLVVKIIKVGGNNRARRNLFTTLFSGDLLSHNGGAIVAYLLFDGEGVVRAAGTLSKFQPYTKLKKR